MNISIEKTLFFNLSLYHGMTSDQKKIAEIFAWHYRLLMCGIHKESFPGHENIARKVGCDVRTVTRFLKKYEPLIFDKIERPSKYGKRQSNRYHYNKYFFIPLCFFKSTGTTKNWHKNSKEILRKCSECEWDFSIEIRYDFDFVNKQMSCGDGSKCPTKDLRISTKCIRVRVPKEGVPSTNDHQKKSKPSEILRIPNLSHSAKASFDQYGSVFLAYEINKDYDYSLKFNNKIRFPCAWLLQRAEDQMKYQCKIFHNHRKNFYEKR